MPRFPSTEWFEEVTRAFEADDERLKRLGYVDADVGILIESDGAPTGYVLEFRGYGPRATRETAHPAEEAEFVIAGALDAWREMIENIAQHNEADLSYTLNRLTMAGTPLRVIARDQLAQDLFFRFNQSFQAFFDASAKVRTEFGVPIPA